MRWPPERAYLSTSIYAALIVLRKQRLSDEPVRFLDFSKQPLVKMLLIGLSKALETRQWHGRYLAEASWPQTDINYLWLFMIKEVRLQEVQSLPNTVHLRI